MCGWDWRFVERLRCEVGILTADFGQLSVEEGVVESRCYFLTSVDNCRVIAVAKEIADLLQC